MKVPPDQTAELRAANFVIRWWRCFANTVRTGLDILLRAESVSVKIIPNFAAALLSVVLVNHF